VTKRSGGRRACSVIESCSGASGWSGCRARCLHISRGFLRVRLVGADDTVGPRLIQPTTYHRDCAPVLSTTRPLLFGMTPRRGRRHAGHARRGNRSTEEEPHADELVIVGVAGSSRHRLRRKLVRTRLIPSTRSVPCFDRRHEKSSVSFRFVVVGAARVLERL